jgi:hypothetical protein
MRRTKATFAAAVFLFVVLVPGAALAQLPAITPKTSITPTRDTGGWVFWMAEGAIIIGAVIVIGVVLSYLRFAPRFFGREETPRPVPGQRPPSLAREAAAIRQVPSAPATAVAGASAAAARPAAATAVAERPAPAAAPAASATTTAPPEGEPAVQADAVGQAEAEAPEARPTAKTAEEVGTGEAPAPAEPQAEAAAAPAPTPAPQPAASHGRGDTMDQATFDRVLKEQLDKGVDRRVAEGRARAAAVVAARKKTQG